MKYEVSIMLAEVVTFTIEANDAATAVAIADDYFGSWDDNDDGIVGYTYYESDENGEDVEICEPVLKVVTVDDDEAEDAGLWRVVPIADKVDADGCGNGEVSGL